MSRKFSAAVIALLGAAALSGCADRAGLYEDPTSTSMHQNIVAQASNSYQSQRMIAMASRFRAASPDTVTFEFNSAELDPEARRVLDIQAQWLTANPSVRMRVTGHADAVGTPGYNTKIGLRRARAVVRYLAAKGVATTRLDAVESKGETELLVQTADRERRNRRTVTDVAGFERGFAGPDMDGRRAVQTYYAYTSDKAEAASSEATN